ncbi:NAD(P)-dependent oxidoreductase [Microvirga sp. WGZ8]|uniref:NAD(P)-dependent oxidoreductase n=1 Tax=Microvirga puerhi TaxID=2876078 RepID=A0ABS7VJ10_9HYPH|nr:NAD(P)-dependent oxidoreductase [Microvirga puerhi]
MTKEHIGFIGVGHMGHGMAKNLVEKGWPLTILGHRNRKPVEDLKSRGAVEASNPRQLAELSDVVILCVTGSPEVQANIQGPNGLMSANKPLLIIDCSTSDPSVTTKLAAELSYAGSTLIDAPLGRTPADAQAGTLDVMVGGSSETVERIRPVLDAFASRVIHTGPTGTGHTMKLLNNFLSMGYASLYAEALALGAKAGIASQLFDSVIRGGRMDCGFYQTYFKWVLDRDPSAHKFTLRNGLKDMTYLASFAQSVGLANPMGATVRNSFATAVGMGHGDSYVPMLSDIIAELNGMR